MGVAGGRPSQALSSRGDSRQLAAGASDGLGGGVRQGIAVTRRLRLRVGLRGSAATGGQCVGLSGGLQGGASQREVGLVPERHTGAEHTCSSHASPAVLTEAKAWDRPKGRH